MSMSIYMSFDTAVWNVWYDYHIAPPIAIKPLTPFESWLTPFESCVNVYGHLCVQMLAHVWKKHKITHINVIECVIAYFGALWMWLVRAHTYTHTQTNKHTHSPKYTHSPTQIHTQTHTHTHMHTHLIYMPIAFAALVMSTALRMSSCLNFHVCAMGPSASSKLQWEKAPF